MASKEIEILDSAATVEKLRKFASRRALNRRNFMAGVGVTSAIAGAALVSSGKTARPRTVSAAGPTQPDILNFALNIEFLEATFYSYITQGADLPFALTQGSGAITGNPATKLTFTGTNAQQITDLFNEIYYDELNHVINLRNVITAQGGIPITRPALNLAAYAAITANNALSIARVLEDVGVTAYTGAAIALTGTNLTYAAQILGVEGFHAGAIRLAVIQNPSIAGALPTQNSGVTFTGNATSGSAVISAVYFLSATPLAVGQVVTGFGLAGTPAIVSITGAGTGTNLNTATTGTFASGATSITAVPATTTGLAVGQVVTGTGIAAATTITAIATVGSGSSASFTLTISVKTTAAGTAAALLVGTASVTLSAKSTVTAATTTYFVGASDSMDVIPADPGTPALSAAGPTAAGAFFATSGAATTSVLVPTGTAFARTTSQVLAILYGTAGVPATATIAKGGFFPSGFAGAITTI